VPNARAPLVLTAPLEETLTELLGLVVTKVTPPPSSPVVTSWSVKVAELDDKTDPVVGVTWVMVGVTVRV
jgi:hypothetical protein